MAIATIPPGRVDEAVARLVSAHASPAVEKIAGTLTWAGDEHVVIAATAIVWMLTRRANPRARALGSHLLVSAVAASVVPHLLKAGINQTRPDRLYPDGHRRGVPVSGKPRDAFPSGHAVQLGVLASASALLPSPWALALRMLAAVVAATRLVVMAHWLSDVICGLAIGAAIEHALRPVRFRPRARSPGNERS